MPSSYTPLLRLTLPADGELTGTWGQVVNQGITALIEAAVAGTAVISLPDANYTLTSVTGAVDQARNAVLVLTGTLTATRNVICPAASKSYVVQNSTSQSIVFKTAAGSGVTIPAGATMPVRCDGTNVVIAFTALVDLTLTGTLALNNLAYTGTLTGGTGVVNLGSGQFYKDAAGNIGIGTTAPAVKVELRTSAPAAMPAWNAADALLLTAGSNNVLQLHAGDNAGTLAYAFSYANQRSRGAMVYIPANDSLSLVTAATERVRVDGAGNVGIGTTPSAWWAGRRTLQLGGAGADASLACSPGTVNFLALASNTYTDASVVSRYVGAGPSTSYVQANGEHIWYNAPSGAAGAVLNTTERMRIDPNGNVGIGATAPAYSLDIRAAEPSVSVRKPGANSNFYGYNIMAGTDILSAWLMNATSGQVSHIAGYAGFGGFFTFTTNGVERVRINASGNVGIGTASPEASSVLTLRSSASVPLPLSLINRNGNQKWGITVDAAVVDDKAFAIIDNTAVAERFRIDTSGNVGISVSLGIGTTTPGVPLEVRKAGAQVNIAARADAGQAALVNISGNNNALGATSFDLAQDNANAAFVINRANAGLSFGTNNSIRAAIDAAGVFTYGGIEIGYRGIPNVGTTGGTAGTVDRGKMYVTTGGITVPNATFAAGDTFSIYNNSGAAVTITQGASLTLRQAGTTNTGNRTLAARGICTVTFISGSEAIISGAGVS